MFPKNVKRLLQATLVFLATGMLSTFLWASAASAHLGIDTSNPKNAAELTQAPSEAVLTFTADVDLSTAAAQLRILGGVDTPISQATNRDVETLPLEYLRGDGRTAIFDLPELEPGLYALDWVINEAGGHSSSSFILFKVSGGSLRPFLLFLGFAVATGALVVVAVRRLMVAE